MNIHLKILLPDQILVDAHVSKVSAEAPNGAFTLLPRHIDFVSALSPGIFSYTDTDGKAVYLAVDEGTLVKKGPEVLVSTPRAVMGPELEELNETVDREFKVLDDREKRVRSASAKIEAGFVRRFLEIQGAE
ncbi:MAG: F0F1 ATP synthase subunit epsilon [Thermodesulfobacteriota bacterium]